MQGLKDGTYRINITGWRDCVLSVVGNKVVQGNYPLVEGKIFDEVLMWFMENSPNRGVQLRREK